MQTSKTECKIERAFDSISMFCFITIFFISYLIGSLTAGKLIGHLYGKDVQQCGTGNIGATNVTRSIGKKAGIVTLILDAAKGFLCVWIIPSLLSCPEGISINSAAIGVVVGHCYSLFLNFNGGKGVATSLGVFLFIFPMETLATLVVFALIIWKTGWVSLGSLTCGPIILLACLISGNFHFSKVIVIILLTVLITWRHRGNINRLLSGIEPKLGYKIHPQQVSSGKDLQE